MDGSIQQNTFSIERVKLLIRALPQTNLIYYYKQKLTSTKLHGEMSNVSLE